MPVAVADLQVVGGAAGAAVEVQHADVEVDPLPVSGSDAPFTGVTCEGQRFKAETGGYEDGHKKCVQSVS